MTSLIQKIQIGKGMTSSGWNEDELVLHYFHHSELQRQGACELMGLHPLKGDEHVLDFGCGDGKLSAQVSHSLPNGMIIGIDLSEKMISFAKLKFPQKYYPSLQFIQSEDTQLAKKLPASFQSFDRMHAFFVFHLVPNAHAVLKNLRQLAKPHAKFLIVTLINQHMLLFSAAKRVFDEYGMTPPWKKEGASPAPMFSLEGIEASVQGSGWEISSLKVADTPYTFINRDDFTQWMWGSLIANWNIPKHLAPSFFDKIIDHMVEMEPAIFNEKGTYDFKRGRALIVLEAKD